MKNKISAILILFILIYGCTPNSNSNTNTTPSTTPVAPSSLAGVVVSTTQINLSWTDNSTDETSFKIERKTGTAAYAVVGSVNANIVAYNDLRLTPNTTYTYRVCSYNSVGNSATYTNEITLTTPSVVNLPTLTTTAASSIATTTAVSGGSISSDGGASVTARGVCWSTSANPTVALSTKTTDGTGTGVFTSTMSGLTANTTYYIRAYATNSAGTAYGAGLSFTTSNTSSATSVTDVDGNTYQLVTICNQIWTKSNLNVSHYRNGDVIPQVTDPMQWRNLTTGAWCYYNNDTANGPVYGKIYNWYAVHDARGLAPVGFHMASDAEWSTLVTCLGGLNLAGGAMKETGLTHWNSPNGNATNSSGFTGLPDGGRGNDGTFTDLGDGADFWVNTETGTTTASKYALNRVSGYTVKYEDYKTAGCSIRALKD